MSEDIENLPDTYGDARKAGQKEISRSWQRLSKDTRTWLLESQHYNEHGSLIEAQSDNSDVEDLEFNVGLISRCAKATLPQRSEKNVLIPPEAHPSDFPSALSFLMYHPCGQDPVFLRQALHALQRYEMASLLCILPAEKVSSTAKNVGLFLFGGFILVLLLATPAILADGLVSIARGSYGDTATALYGLGFIAWMFNIARGMGKEAETKTGTKEEKTYKAWAFLNYYQAGDWTAAGAGAATYFQEMRAAGLTVPLIAFDLCESLQAKIFH